jgi:hypothetical protein
VDLTTEERRAYNPPANVPDSISRLVGDVAYLRGQHFQDCRIENQGVWRRPFRFSRWYFRPDPKVLVDIMARAEVRRRGEEIAFKRAWAAKLGWRYALVVGNDMTELHALFDPDYAADTVAVESVDDAPAPRRRGPRTKESAA